MACSLSPLDQGPIDTRSPLVVEDFPRTPAVLRWFLPHPIGLGGEPMKGREGMMGQPKIGHSVVVGSIFLLALSVLILTAITESRADTEATLEFPPPATVEETLSPMDMSF